MGTPFEEAMAAARTAAGEMATEAQSALHEVETLASDVLHHPGNASPDVASLIAEGRDVLAKLESAVASVAPAPFQGLAEEAIKGLVGEVESVIRRHIGAASVAASPVSTSAPASESAVTVSTAPDATVAVPEGHEVDASGNVVPVGVSVVHGA